MKKTFIVRDAKGNPIGEPVNYHPVSIIVLNAVYELALHKMSNGEWAISDPISGGKLANLKATYKGVPCSSESFTVKQAHQVALLEIESLIQRCGSEKFASVIDKARANVKE